MGRRGITYEQVEAAADSLYAERPGSVTLAAVRAHLGTGSPNTIHRFLKMWDENRPKNSAPVVSIPDEVTRALSNWASQAATGARAESEERSVQAQAAADELARAGEELEAERDQLLAEIATLTKQRDQEQATASERAIEIQRLLGEVERERGLAGAAQVDAAQAKLRAESQVEHLAEMRERVASLSSEIETERAARTAAERDVAVGASQLGAARAELEETKARVKALSSEVEAERTARTGAEREAAVVAAQLVDVRAELDATRGEAEALRQDLVEHRERIDQIRSTFEARAQQDQSRLDQLRHDYETRLDEERRALTDVRSQLAAVAVEKAQLQERLTESLDRMTKKE